MSEEDTPGAPVFQYNLTRSGFVGGTFLTLEIGDVSTMGNYTVVGDQISFTYDDTDSGITPIVAYWIIADDGQDEIASCLVVFNVDVQGSQSSCSLDRGLSGFMRQQSASPGTDIIDFRFTFEDDFETVDPSDFTFALWVYTGSSEFQAIADVSNLTGYQEGGGVFAFPFTRGGIETSYEYWIVGTSDNTTIQTCRVTMETGTPHHFDACGRMVTEWRELYCLPPVPTNDVSGFNYRKNVIINSEVDPGVYGFARSLGEAARGEHSIAAINLPGDTRSYRFHFSIEAAAEGQESNFNVFFSTVPLEATSQNDPGPGAARPVSGAFSDGYGLQLHEAISGWDVDVYRNEGGQQTVLRSESWATGIDPNTREDGIFTVDPWQGVITATMGSESIVVDLDDRAPQAGATYSLWLRENGGFSLFQAVTTLYAGAPPVGCIHTASTMEQFGGVAEAGAGGELNQIPSFSGEGGFLTDEPMFPGMNVANQATSMGLTSEQLGYILAGVIAFLVGFGALAFLGPFGGGLGFFASVGLSSILGLIPAWFLIVGFMALVSGVAVQVKAGA